VLCLGLGSVLGIVIVLALDWWWPAVGCWLGWRFGGTFSISLRERIREATKSKYLKVQYA